VCGLKQFHCLIKECLTSAA